MIQLAKWDTDHFGLKVGHLLWQGEVDMTRVKEIVAEAQKDGYQLLYLKGVTLPKEELDKRFVLADRRAMYELRTKKKVAPCDGHVKSMLHHELTKELLELAWESGLYSRYNRDERFPKEAFRTLYRIWMENSLKGTMATDVLAYVEEGVPVGIITYKTEEDAVVIGLVAVNGRMANRGIGTRLMQAFLSSFDQGTCVRVATQMDNLGACHFYEKNGFALKEETPIYHIWTTEETKQ